MIGFNEYLNKINDDWTIRRQGHAQDGNIQRGIQSGILRIVVALSLPSHLPCLAMRTGGWSERRRVYAH